MNTVAASLRLMFVVGLILTISLVRLVPKRESGTKYRKYFSAFVMQVCLGKDMILRQVLRYSGIGVLGGTCLLVSGGHSLWRRHAGRFGIRYSGLYLRWLKIVTSVPCLL